MKIRLRISLITILSLILCCFGLWFFNYCSTHNLIQDIKEIESCDEERSYAKLIAIEDRGKENLDSLWLSLIVVIFIGGGVSFIAIKNALKPFRELSEKLKDFHTSDLKKPIPLPKTKDESYELISSYNNMLEKLNLAFEREKRITANIAHEFKTPLSVIIAACEVLEMKKNPSTEDYKRILEIAKDKAEYLSEITSTLLSIHRQTQKVNNSECNLGMLLSSIKEDLIIEADKRGISININCPKIHIICDRLLFGQMLNNFIENAVKYNINNGSVNIIVKEDKESRGLNIFINDTGKGIPEKSKALIFEPFYRVDESRNKEYGGVGLGLSFAKAVSDIYGGSIHIEDNEPAGTKITLLFPDIIVP